MAPSAQLSGFRYVACILAVLTTYVVTRPYVGLSHDALLYAMQALHLSGIQELGADVVFQSGNQSAFSVFPQIQAYLVQTLGLGLTTPLLQTLGAAFWLLSAMMLARAIYPSRMSAVAALAISLVVSPYFGNGAFSYAENFVTARPFAEAFGMLAIAVSMRDRFVVALLALIACAVVHPLTAVGAIAICLALALKSFFRVMIVAVAVMVVVDIAAKFGLAPATWFRETYDPEWKGILADQNSLGFMSLWAETVLRTVALPFVILAVATSSSSIRIAQLSRIVVTMTALLVVVSLVGADLLENRLVATTQLWRILGWFTLIANLMALHVLVSWGVNRSLSVLLILALIVSGVEYALNSLPVFSPILAALVALATLVDRRGGFWKFLRWLLIALSMPVLLGAASMIYVRLTNVDTLDAVDVLVRFGLIGMAALTFAAVRQYGWIAVPLSVLALAGGLSVYDARDGWTRFVEGPQQLPSRLQNQLVGRTVYWEDGLSLMWIKLGQPQYYSCNQRAGGLFFREQAIEVERRANLLAPLNSHDFSSKVHSTCVRGPDPDLGGTTDWRVIQNICRSEPELDVLMLHTSVPALSGRTYKVGWGQSERTVHMLRCATIR